MAAGVPLENAKVAAACGEAEGRAKWQQGERRGGRMEGVRHRWSHSNIRAMLCYIKEQC